MASIIPQENKMSLKTIVLKLPYTCTSCQTKLTSMGTILGHNCSSPGTSFITRPIVIPKTNSNIKLVSIPSSALDSQATSTTFESITKSSGQTETPINVSTDLSVVAPSTSASQTTIQSDDDDIVDVTPKQPEIICETTPTSPDAVRVDISSALSDDEGEEEAVSQESEDVSYTDPAEWDHTSVLALIHAYRTFGSLEHVHTTQKLAVWKNIAGMLNYRGYKYSWVSCAKKINELLAKYKSIVACAPAKAKKLSEEWEYFNIIKSLAEKKPQQGQTSNSRKRMVLVSSDTVKTKRIKRESGVSEIRTMGQNTDSDQNTDLTIDIVESKKQVMQHFKREKTQNYKPASQKIEKEENQDKEMGPQVGPKPIPLRKSMLSIRRNMTRKVLEKKIERLQEKEDSRTSKKSNLKTGVDLQSFLGDDMLDSEQTLLSLSNLSMPSLSMPSLSMPNLSMPSMPDLLLPLQMPSLSMPFSMPGLSMTKMDNNKDNENEKPDPMKDTADLVELVKQTFDETSDDSLYKAARISSSITSAFIQLLKLKEKERKTVTPPTSPPPSSPIRDTGNSISIDSIEEPEIHMDEQDNAVELEFEIGAEEREREVQQELEKTPKKKKKPKLNEKEKEEKKERKKEAEEDAIQLIPSFSDQDFKLHFRMSRSSVEALCCLLAEHVPLRLISLERKVLSILWLLGNRESFRLSAERFNFTKGSLYGALCVVCEALKIVKNDIIVWPQGNDIREIAVGFQKISKLQGVAGALGISHIRIGTPNQSERRGSYMSKYGHPSVQLQAVCDNNLQFLDVYTGAPGSADPEEIFKTSPLATLLDVGNLPDNYHILAPNSYALRPYLMVPFLDNGCLTHNQIVFNQNHTTAWSLIDQCFYLMKSKFKRMQKLDVKEAEKATPLIAAACVLYNFILKREGFEASELENIELEGDVTETEIIQDLGDLAMPDLTAAEMEDAQVKRMELANLMVY